MRAGRLLVNVCGYACAGVWCLLVPLTIALAAADAWQFRSRAEAVQVDVLVTHDKRLVRGLTKDNFELRADGVPQVIQLLEIGAHPVDVILVFDTSVSVAGELQKMLRLAAEALVDRLAPHDRVALLSFNNRVRVHAPLTDDHSRVRLALSGLKAEGRTALRDGAFAGLLVKEDTPRRTLLVLFSDGVDTASWISRSRLERAAARNEAVVYALVLQLRGFSRQTEMLHELTRQSGGRLVEAGRPQDLSDQMVAILTEFRERYLLSFVPAGISSAGWHTLSVKLKKAKGKVQVRRGYFAE
jgi:Ca-activated chloride channel family protein